MRELSYICIYNDNLKCICRLSCTQRLSAWERGMGGYSRSRKPPRGFIAHLTFRLPSGCTNKGNQQEAHSSQTPGGVSHRTWHRPSCHVTTLLWNVDPHSSALTGSLFLSVLPACSLAQPPSQTQSQRQQPRLQKEAGPLELRLHADERIWLIARSFPGQTHRSLLPYKQQSDQIHHKRISQKR